MGTRVLRLGAYRVRISAHAVLGVLLAPVLCINLLVRVLGGADVQPLSPYHLGDKSVALGLLLRHGLGHVVGGDGDDWPDMVDRTGKAARLPPGLARAVAQAESDFRPHAMSATGAMGIMQLMPATARAYGVEDPFDPIENAGGATRYLAFLWKRYRGDRRRVLAAYNTGPGRIPVRGPYDVPAETRAYIARVLTPIP